MEGTRIWRWLSKAVALTMLAAMMSRPAWAADEAIQQAILKLASNDKQERAAALAQLAHSHDGGLVDFMTALNSGSIYAWKSDSGLKVVRNDKSFTAPDGVTKLAPLADPITNEPLLADGKPIVVPLKKLDDIGPVGPERRTISAAITSLALWSPDFERRLTAVLRAGSSGNPKLIPDLEELAHSNAPEKIRRTASESIDLVHLSTADTPEDREAAAKALADLHSAGAVHYCKTAWSRWTRTPRKASQSTKATARPIRRRSTRSKVISAWCAALVTYAMDCRWARFSS